MAYAGSPLQQLFYSLGLDKSPDSTMPWKQLQPGVMQGPRHMFRKMPWVEDDAPNQIHAEPLNQASSPQEPNAPEEGTLEKFAAMMLGKRPGINIPAKNDPSLGPMAPPTSHADNLMQGIPAMPYQPPVNIKPEMQLSKVPMDASKPQIQGTYSDMPPEPMGQAGSSMPPFDRINGRAPFPKSTPFPMGMSAGERVPNSKAPPMSAAGRPPKQMASTGADSGGWVGNDRAINKGDTLWGIAKGMMGPQATPQMIQSLVKLIASQNNIADPNKIKAGGKLSFPSFDSAPKPSRIAKK